MIPLPTPTASTPFSPLRIAREPALQPARNSDPPCSAVLTSRGSAAGGGGAGIGPLAAAAATAAIAAADAVLFKSSPSRLSAVKRRSSDRSKRCSESFSCSRRMVFASCRKRHRWHGADCGSGGGEVVVGVGVLVVAADWISIWAAECLISASELLARRGVIIIKRMGNGGSRLMLKFVQDAIRPLDHLGSSNALACNWKPIFWWG